MWHAYTFGDRRLLPHDSSEREGAAALPRGGSACAHRGGRVVGVQVVRARSGACRACHPAAARPGDDAGADPRGACRARAARSATRGINTLVCKHSPTPTAIAAITRAANVNGPNRLRPAPTTIRHAPANSAAARLIITVRRLPSAMRATGTWTRTTVTAFAVTRAPGPHFGVVRNSSVVGLRRRSRPEGGGKLPNQSR